MGLCESGAVRDAMNVVQQSHSNMYDIDLFQHKLESLISCSELVQDSFCQMLEKQRATIE